MSPQNIAGANAKDPKGKTGRMPFPSNCLLSVLDIFLIVRVRKL